MSSRVTRTKAVAAVLVTTATLLVTIVWVSTGALRSNETTSMREGAFAPFVAPKGDFPGEAAAFRSLQEQDESGDVPDNALLRAKAHADVMRAAQTSSLQAQNAGVEPGSWTWLGPGNIGGRVRAIAIHPTTPNTMWLGSTTGGIWKTLDGGAHWAPLDDFMANLAVTSIIVNQATPLTLYAGTGEGFTQSTTHRGAGVFKTIDGGATWRQLLSTATSDWYFVNRLTMSPSDSNVLLAATGSGIWRSTTGGDTWTKSTGIASTIEPQDIDFHPTDGMKAVAGGRRGTAWYTTDGGVSWTVASGIPSSTDTRARVEVTYSRSNPLIVYASVNLNSGDIYKSTGATNGGETYNRVNTGNAYLSNQGFYDNVVWVDPTNPETLVVGGIDLWRSTNGGTTLTKISQWNLAPASAHADHHAIVAHPNYDGTTNMVVYFGNDGGIYKAENVLSVATNAGWQELNNHLGITQFYSGLANSSGKITGGTQDNGTLRYNGGTETWDTTSEGDGGFSAADSDFLYGEYVYLNLHRTAVAGAAGSGQFIAGCSYLSSPSGPAWVCKDAPYVIPDARDSIRDNLIKANFIAPFALDPNNTNRILAGGHSLWRTNDARTANTPSAGPAWASIRGPITVGGVNPPISAIAIAQGNSALVWIGYNSGHFYVSTNATSATPTWTESGPTLPGRMVTRIVIHPTDHNVVYVMFGGFSGTNLWASTNGGTTWNDISGSGATGLPDVPVRDLEIHPTQVGWLYAATEIGVFSTSNGGATWEAPNDGPANVPVDELSWRAGKLLAATHGRGMFEANVLVTAQPANDNFAAAQVLIGTGGTQSGSTVNASKETGEPSHAPNGNVGGASVWYQWVAPATGRATFDTLTSVGQFDTVLAAYTGTSVSALTTVSPCTPSGNDGSMGCKSNDIAGTSGGASALNFDVVGGTTYRIAVDGFREPDSAVAAGSLSLNWTSTAAAVLAAFYSTTPPTSWTSGQSQTYSITLRNDGSQTWNATGTNMVRLGVHFGSASDVPHNGWATDVRINLLADLAPGASVTRTITLTAPATGSYVLRHRMVKEGVAWFDQINKTNVTVN